MVRWPVILLVGLGVGACGVFTSPNNGVMCTMEFRYGLAVYVKDSVTAAPAASGATLIARDGVWADTVSFAAGNASLDGLGLNTAGERAGTYTLTVRKAGYHDWVKSGVVVTADECHVHPVAVTALLVPSTP